MIEFVGRNLHVIGVILWVIIIALIVVFFRGSK